MATSTATSTTKFPGYLSPSAGLKFADVPNGLAAISKVPAAGWGQILAYMAFCEVSQDQSPGTPAAAGDFGFKVLTASDPAEKAKKLSAELANGRLAHLERGYLEVAGNDLKEISPAKSQYKWSISHKFFNKMMHSMNGNSGFCLLLMIELCLAFVMGPGYMSCVTYGESFTPTFNDFFFGAMVALLLRLSRVRCFPKSLLAMMSFTLGAWSCAFPFLFWTCINVSLAWLSLVKGLRRAQLLTCRTVGRQRRVKRRRITFKRCKMTKVLLCVLMTSSLFLPLPQQTNPCMRQRAVIFAQSHIFVPSRTWTVSRRARNRYMQSLNGNTATVGSAQGRTKWESSAHAPGLSVANIDELELPPNAVAIQLRADQVCTGATGISLCNCTFLKAKLDAIGGSYLCLIVPGTIGVDLKNMLQSARPGLLPNCVQGRLTLSDPATNRTFVKQVVLINLGTTPVKFAQLDDTVAVQDDSSLSVWFHGYQRQSPDEWHSTIRPTLSDSRDMLRKRIGILGIEVSNLETWNVVVTADPPAFRGCLRVADSQAKKLYNCKDNLIFFRPFISQNLKPQPEDGIVIMWTKFETLPALALVANTLDGAHGFVSNGHSLGVRINKTSVRHARSVLQKPNPRICETNQNVFGTSTYEISGFPPGI